jgi:Trypsin-co-occurring domain 1
MSGNVRAGGTAARRRSTGKSEQRLVPMRVGDATVYIEQFGEPAVVESEGHIRTVSPPTPEEAFQTGGDILRECVRVIGERIAVLAERTRPEKIVVEFSLSFAVKGKASLIPVLLTGESSANTGLKITAEWTRLEAKDG